MNRPQCQDYDFYLANPEEWVVVDGEPWAAFCANFPIPDKPLWDSISHTWNVFWNSVFDLFGFVAGHLGAYWQFYLPAYLIGFVTAVRLLVLQTQDEMDRHNADPDNDEWYWNSANIRHVIIAAATWPIHAIIRLLMKLLFPRGIVSRFAREHRNAPPTTTAVTSTVAGGEG